MGLAVLALPVVLVAFLVAVTRRRVVTVGVNEHAEVAAIARSTQTWRALGLVAGLVVGGLLLFLGQRVDALGRVTALAPVAVGAGVLLGTVVGERTARPAVGVQRTAAVETRTLADVLPRFRAWLLAASTAVLGGVLAVGWAWGAQDGAAAGERALLTRCTSLVDGSYSSVVSIHSPWPGSFYAGPLAVALVVVAVLVLGSLRAVVARPRPPLASRGLDSLLRRWSAGNVLTAGLFTVLGTLGPVALVVGVTLLDTGCPSTTAQVVVRWVALVVGPLAMVGAAAALGGLLVSPTIRVDDLPRPLPGDAAPVGAPVR